MKASEKNMESLDNDYLARVLDEQIATDGCECFVCKCVREAAARLRKATCSSDGCSVIAYPVNNNGSFGGRARNSIPCTTIKDANGEALANVIGSPVRNRSDAMRIANEICQSLNANAVLREEGSGK